MNPRSSKVKESSERAAFPIPARGAGAAPGPHPAGEARAVSAPASATCSPESTTLTSQSSRAVSQRGVYCKYPLHVPRLKLNFSIKGGSGLLSHAGKIEFCYLSGEDKSQLL